MANVKEVGRIIKVLQQYRKASSQVMNLEKLEASFSRNMDDEGINLICHKMGVKIVIAHAK